jgi:protein tyrosine phosphatase
MSVFVGFFLLSSSSDLGQVGVLFSAGVGRTGTFIAIDALHEHGHKTGYIDIMEYVQMMRKEKKHILSHLY